MDTRDEMELPEPKIRAQYPQALALLTGFDHAPRLAAASRSNASAETRGRWV